MSFYFESVLEDACRCGEFVEFWLVEEDESARAEILGFAAIYSKKNLFERFFDEQMISAGILAQALQITCSHGKDPALELCAWLRTEDCSSDTARICSRAIVERCLSAHTIIDQFRIVT